MSIERSSAPASPKATAAADGTSNQGKVKVVSEADAAAGGGFFAILTALEPQVADDAGGMAGSDATPQAEPDAAQAAVLPAPSLLLAQGDSPGLPSELAMLLSQAGQAVQTGQADPASEATGRKAGRAVPGGILSAQAALSADPGAPASPSLLSPEVDKARQHRANVSALLDQMAQGLSGAAQKTAGFDLKAVAAASLAESKGLHEAALSGAMAREPALSTALMASGLGEGLMRAADRPGSKSSSQINGLGLEGSWGSSSFQAGNKVDVPSAVIDPSATSFDSALADTMSYWVSQGVQNAELKIEGLDGESIAVSISLNGDEAHIGFRTDKPETRQMLEGAVAHLKELLTSEGLVLSGVSVGASGQEGAPGQEQKNPPGGRQTSLISTENIPAENLRPVTKAVGRALDLYV